MSDAYSELYTPPKREGRASSVSWTGKLWPDFTDRNKLELMAHVRELEKQKAIDYIAYLRNHCGVPKSFTDSLSWKGK